MSLLALSNELLLCIAEALEWQRDINAFVRTNQHLYNLLNTTLYRYNIKHEQSSALFWAARTGQLATARKLIDEGANPDTTAHRLGFTPLGCAAGRGHEEMVELLLAAGANPNGDSFGTPHCTPIADAAREGHENIVKLLLSVKGVRVWTFDMGVGPLVMAAMYGHDSVLKLLLEDIKPQMERAKSSKDEEMLNMPEFINVQDAFHAAVLHGQKNTVEVLLEQPLTDPDWMDEEDNLTPLAAAVMEEHVDIVKILLARDEVDPNQELDNGQTPLILAAREGSTEIVRALLASKKTDPNCMDEEGLTPLLYAITEGRIENVLALLEHELLDPNYGDDIGGTPLMWAARGNRIEMVEALLSRKDIKPDRTADDGKTALSWAAFCGRPEIVRILLSKGVDPNHQDNRGRTPLLSAVECGDVQVVKMLLDNEAVDAGQADLEGQTPLLRCAQSGYTEVLKVLLQSKVIDPNRRDQQGQTALIKAAKHGSTRVLQTLLLNENVDPNCKCDLKRTPLIWAAASDKFWIVKELLQNDKIDTTARDERGNTALDTAIRYGYPRVVEAFLEKMEDPADIFKYRTLVEMMKKYVNSVLFDTQVTVEQAFKYSLEWARNPEAFWTEHGPSPMDSMDDDSTDEDDGEYQFFPHLGFYPHPHDFDPFGLYDDDMDPDEFW